MKPICPKCKSTNVTLYEDDGISFLACNVCGYDELDELYPAEDVGEKTSQREKGRYTPYKSGGKGRTRK